MEWVIIIAAGATGMGMHLLWRIAGRLDDIYEALSSKILADETKKDMSMNTSSVSSEEKSCRRCGGRISRHGYCERCEKKYEPE